MGLSYAEFINKARAAHGDRYTYPAWAGEKLTKDKVAVLCPKHGEFLLCVNDHVNSRKVGCHKCAVASASEERADTFSSFVAKARAIHGDKYEYLEPPILRHTVKVQITCPDHGKFFQKINSHLRGSGCPVCAEPVRNKNKRKTASEFLRRARAKHGDRFEYPLLENFQGMRSPVAIVCPDHGLFEQEAWVHVRSPFSCPKCGQEHTSELCRLTPEFIEKRLEDKHADQPWTFVSRKDEYLLFHCARTRRGGEEHGEFSMSAGNFSAGKGCPACAKVRSRAEDQVTKFIQSLGFETFKGNNRTIPGLGRRDLDIVIAEKNLAIEYNGVVWHSERFKPGSTVHRDKTELAESLGYRLIQIFEDEWVEKPEAVKARLRAILGVDTKKIGARKTGVIDVTWAQAAEFLNKHHLQGCGSPAKICLALRHKGDIVAVATFGPARYDGSADWELLRLAFSCRVVGGAGKLLAAFKAKEDVGGGSLVSYADRRWSDGGVYKALGFKFSGYTPPNYAYVKGVKRYGRTGFQKHKLEKLLATFDPTKSEVQNCWDNGFYRIFDCGSSKWVLDLNA